jgi:protein-tyrosine phosphatase
MAEGIMKKLTEESGEPWLIGSAGTWTINGEQAAAKTMQVLNQRGIDISGHRSRQINEDILNRFQLVLTMEQGHKEALRIEFPKVRQRIFLISEMIGQKYEIDDPMGRSLLEFSETADEITSILENGMGKIKELAQTITG